MRNKIAVLLLMSIIGATVSAADKSQTVQEVIDQHLAAIGTADARAKAKSVGVRGSVLPFLDRRRGW